MTESASQCAACLGSRIEGSGYAVDRIYPVMHCLDCGLSSLQIPDDAPPEIDEYWDDVSERVYAHPSVEEELRGKYRRYFGTLSSRAPNKRFLDVGSGIGLCVDTAAREFGFDAMGVEPSARAVEIARDRFGVQVIEGYLDEDTDAPRDLGALTLWDVIEHVESPEVLVRNCAARLAPGGVFLLETPNEQAFLRKVILAVAATGISRLDLRRSIYYPAHRFYFTRKAMRGLLERCGFGEPQFFTDHSMYRKELVYMSQYKMNSAFRRTAVRATAMMTALVPQLGNKMIVMATRTDDPV